MSAALLAMALLGSAQQLANGVTLYPEDKQVVLSGRIEFRHGYGPPGWGEDPKHDEHIVYWVMELPRPVSTPCTPERPEWASTDCQTTKRLRLLIETNLPLVNEARLSRGRKVAVTGTLHRQATAGEMTPIVMDVTAIKQLP